MLEVPAPFPVGAILNTDTSGKSEGPIAQFDQDVIIAMAAIMCDDGTIDRSEINAALFAYPRLCRKIYRRLRSPSIVLGCSSPSDCLR